MQNLNLTWKNGSNKFISKSEKETFALGNCLAEKLFEGCIVAFFGDLGVGKTTLIKGILNFFKVKKTKVTSPTFTYLHVYPVKDVDIYHFDLYRLHDSGEFLSMGFDEYLNKNICLIEWAEKIKDILPANVITCSIKHQLQSTMREIIISYGPS